MECLGTDRRHLPYKIILLGNFCKEGSLFKKIFFSKICDFSQLGVTGLPSTVFNHLCILGNRQNLANFGSLTTKYLIVSFSKSPIFIFFSIVLCMVLISGSGSLGTSSQTSSPNCFFACFICNLYIPDDHSTLHNNILIFLQSA